MPIPCYAIPSNDWIALTPVGYPYRKFANRCCPGADARATERLVHGPLCHLLFVILNEPKRVHLGGASLNSLNSFF